MQGDACTCVCTMATFIHSWALHRVNHHQQPYNCTSSQIIWAQQPSSAVPVTDLHELEVEPATQYSFISPNRAITQATSRVTYSLSIAVSSYHETYMHCPAPAMRGTGAGSCKNPRGRAGRLGGCGMHGESVIVDPVRESVSSSSRRLWHARRGLPA